MQAWRRYWVVALPFVALALLFFLLQHNSRDRLVSRARGEGHLVIYSVTDSVVARPLVAAFEARYGVRVDYREMNSIVLQQRFLEDVRQGTPVADVLWSSAMDLQIKLANDGHAAAYSPYDAQSLPPWAGYQQQVWVTSFEPVVFVYNRELLQPHEVPESRLALRQMLQRHPGRFQRRISSYDIERSAVGFNFFAQDVRVAREEAWRLQRQFGRSKVRLHGSSATMLDELSAGQTLLAYNVIGSYAAERAGKDPRLGVIYPHDYTLVMGRLALISRYAPHPSAAKLWLDFVLSEEGQRLLARTPGTFSVRRLASEARDFDALSRLLGDSFEPIFPGRGLLIYLDDLKRNVLLQRWREATGFKS
ncbi:ABC transporter substrate-binding protein [Chitiniphilus purpureus]|uniref:ABC transporter substrate-binding protein n=1 Tax=Chitiniphilus purpureus TaxID=2981137 RepID=A0ABY6DJW6_9NEIS|nr:ABC transporter substrate-binding protein [Chitiniphilus sp. CD1]UXY14327.1 ABC transporter substrate-binding protein [Chitiniphilus sp. CD1]